MYTDYFTVLVFAGVGIAFCVIAYILARILRKDHPAPEKLATYECGEKPIGEAWSRFRAGFYIFTLLFVIFEVESVFLFPAVLKLGAFKELGMGLLAFSEILVFVAILLLGLVYAWKKGVLKWE